ncbi:MAG TPA: ABC transporter substrate-binding protein [Acidimicrobiales bacterium]|jgi:osmoprotectant transport system substrate-binding protein|nr:ABC transporter substrate-binding protein [Acidimicrobiales bacterium]
MLAIGMVAVVAIAACSSNDNKATTTGGSSASAGAGGGAKPTVTIGAQDFGESAILAEIYKQGLAAKGFTTSTQKLGGFRDLEVKAFDGKTINFAPEYAASMLEFLNGKKGEATSDVTATVAKLKTQLDAKGLAAFNASDAVDTNALVMTQAKASSLGISSLSDLATKGKDLKLGGPADCETNAFCIPGLKRVYNLDLSGKFQALEASAIAAALDAGSIDVALLFSTDGRIAAKNYTLLTDDKKMLAADNVVPVATKDLAANSELASAVNAISAKITTDELIKLNKRFDVDKEDAAVIAKDFLTQNYLI